MAGYVRIFESKWADWFQVRVKPDSLADNMFNLKKANYVPSLYETFSVLDETRIAAAHLFAQLSDDFTEMYLLRIYQEELDAVGLSVSAEHLGRTGVVSVDFAHREIPRQRDAICSLAERIAERLREGEDRIRRIGKSQMEYHIRIFLDRPSTEVTPFAKRRCCALLKSSDSSIDENVMKYVIPESRVRLEAYLRSTDPTLASMDPVRDWLDAESILNAMYIKNYLVTS